MKKFIISSFIVLLILNTSIICYAFSNYYTWSVIDNILETSSSLTENQLAAAVVTMAVIIGLIGIGLFSSLVDVYWIRMTFSWISILGRFGNFSAGVFDISAVIYFVSLIFTFLFLTVRVYEKRRWN